MIKKINRGFTLVEMIVVVLLIGIITLIAIPIYTDITNDSKQSSYKASMNTIINELEKYVISNPKLDYSVQRDIVPLNLSISKKDDIKKGKFYKQNSLIVLVNVSDGEYCANGTKNDLQIKKDDICN